MRVLVFLASGILEDGFCGLFSYEFRSFFETELFFNQSVAFFGFRHFGRWVLWPFAYEFICLFEAELFFLMRVLVFLASGILEDGSVSFFHMNS